MAIKIKFKSVENSEYSNPKLPEYKTIGSSGMDIYACNREDIHIKPGTVEKIPTGWSVEIPYGYEIQIRSRSGLSVKHLLTLPNGIGTIDSDYRGEILVPLLNLGKEEYVVKNGHRIAQAVLCKVEEVEIVVGNELSNTDRIGGFGSTGL